MKVSQEQKVEIRRRLLSAAVELFVEKGFSGTTMREISDKAGFSAGTIYKYFPNKDKIFHAYFDDKVDELVEALKEIEDFDSFTLKEKLQTLLETQLELFTPDREFVQMAFRALLDSPMRSFTEMRPAREKVCDLVRLYFSMAVEVDEIPPQPFERFLTYLFWDYRNLVLIYWLRDDTTAFTNTSRLIDISLDIYTDVVKSGLVTKTADILIFIFQSHIYSNIDRFYDFIGTLSKIRESSKDSSNHG